MAGETIITVVGNLTDDPELRFTPSGAAVANFSVASTPRNFDKNTNEWVDGEAMFLRCSIWRQAAENVAESLQRGMRVVVQGRLKARTYETREGEKRTRLRDRGRRDRPVPEVRDRKGQPHQPPGRRGRLLRRWRRWRSGRWPGGGDQSGPAAADPWATPAPAAGGAAGGGAANDPWGAPGVPADEPPF